MKCTHDSAGLVIVKDKSTFDKVAARRKIENSLQRNYFFSGREWPYKNVVPRIIIEKYMEDKSTKELRDYKFFCFNGKMKCFKVDYNRFTHHSANYYDQDCNLMDFGESICPPEANIMITLPSCISEMKRLAEKLAQGIPFLRVDFYCVNDRIYFGELTFFPDSGFGKFINPEQDIIMGSWLQLPEKSGDNTN